jgi:hypothetical protein
MFLLEAKTPVAVSGHCFRRDAVAACTRSPLKVRLKPAAEPDFVFHRPFSSCLTTDLRYVHNWRAAALSQR